MITAPHELNLKQAAVFRWMVGLFGGGVVAVTAAVGYLLSHTDTRYASRVEAAINAREVESLRERQLSFDEDLDAIHDSLAAISVKLARIEMHLEQIRGVDARRTQRTPTD